MFSIMTLVDQIEATHPEIDEVEITQSLEGLDEELQFDYEADWQATQDEVDLAFGL